MPGPVLAARGAAVLDTIVERFIATGEPVGSVAITRLLPERVSPATVRNVMAELEHLGLLEQPHTSAGRRPTSAGYRRYVESLFAEGRYDSVDPRPLQQQLASESIDIHELLQHTCRLLAELSDLVGVVSAPPFADTVFQHVDLVALDGGRVLAIVVGRGGQVRNRVVTLAEPMSQTQLDRAANYLVRRFAGRSLREVAGRLAELRAGVSERLESYERQALELGADSIPTDLDDTEVLVEGATSLVTRRDFEAREDLQAVLEVIGAPSGLAPALDIASAGRTRVLIGRQPLPHGLGGCSLVAASYDAGGLTRGTVAVLGPTRLPYGRAIAVVEAVAQATSALAARLVS